VRLGQIFAQTCLSASDKPTIRGQAIEASLVGKDSLSVVSAENRDLWR
jgi:hypothetical protein